MRLDTLIVIAVICLIFGIGGVKSCHEERKELKSLRKEYQALEDSVRTAWKLLEVKQKEANVYRDSVDILRSTFTGSTPNPKIVTKYRDNFVLAREAGKDEMLNYLNHEW